MNPATNILAGSPNVGRHVGLLQQPRFEDDSVPERHRLDLVMRDVDRRHAELALQVLELGAHPCAELRIEIRERFVHQEEPRVRTMARASATRCRCPPESSAGAIEELVELQLGGGPDPLTIRAGDAPNLERKPMFSATVMCG